MAESMANARPTGTATILGALGTAATVTVLVLLVLVGSPFRVDEMGRFAPQIVIGVAGLLGWGLALVRPWPGLLLPGVALAALMAAQALSTVASHTPSLAWPALWHQFALLGTTLLAWRAARHATIRPRLVTALVTTFVILSGVYALELAAYFRHWLDLGLPAGRFPLRPGAGGGLAGLPTWMGDYMVLLAPVAAGAAWRAGRVGRVAAVVVLAVAAALLVGTGTRSLWLSAGAIGGIAVLAAILRRPTRPRVALVAVMAVGAGLAAVALDLPARVARDADAGRSSAFGSAIDIFASSPLIGTGPGTYVAERLAHSIPSTAWYVFPSAHSLSLNALAETGILGALAAVAVLLAIAPLVLRAVTHPGRERPVAIGALAGIGMLVLHAHADVVLEMRGIAVLAAASTGLAIWRPDLSSPRPLATPTSTSRVTRMTRAALVVACVFGAVALVPAARSELAAAALFRSYAASDPASARAAAIEAIELDAGLVPAHQRIARLAASSGDLEAAAAALDSVIALEPLAQHRVERAAVQLALGKPTSARADIVKALADDVADPFVRLNAIAIYQAIGADTRESLTVLVRMAPSLIPLLGGTDGSWPGVPAAVLSDAVRVVFDSELAGGNEAGALRIAASSGDATLLAAVRDRLTDPWLRPIADALAGDAAAAARIESDALEAPLSADWPTWAWFLAAGRCDESAAARWADIRGILLRYPPSIPIALSRVPAAAAGMLPPGYPSGIWGVPPDPLGFVDGVWSWTSGTPTCR